MSDTPTDSTIKTSSANVSEIERWASVIGGGILALYGLTRRSPLSFLLAPVGSYLLYRGVTAQDPLYSALGINTAKGGAGLTSKGITVEKTVIINRPRPEVFQYWRTFENLPRFMRNLVSVSTSDDGRSHWVARGPLGQNVEWDAEIINEQEDKLLAWRSFGETSLPNAGLVRFEDAPGGQGTTVRVALEYAPPAGIVGAAVAKLFGREPGQEVDADLRRFKEIMDGGEPSLTGDQLTGSRLGIGDEFIKRRDKRLDTIDQSDQVQEASEASFPASDPPSWTSATEPDSH